jgi:hypothetical protein
MSGVVTLLGAGELMAATSKIHRASLAMTQGSPRPVFIDTPAGFESNIQTIVRKAVDFYRHNLQLDLRVASFRHAGRATPGETAAAVAAIRDANFIFAGPGSPSYAIHQWRGSPVLQALIEQYESHAHLFFASAASITLGRYSLPVYEIYKAGQDPHWIDGLDFLGRLGLNLAVVPHFNDNSGGDNYDSRFCYMGAARFDALQQQLPPDVTILGLDAYTAITIDHHNETCLVHGQGGVTVIGEGGERRYEAGATLPFSALQSRSRDLVTTQDGRVFSGYEFSDEGEAAEDTSGIGSAPDDLVAFIESLAELTPAVQVELLARLEAVRRELQAPPPVADGLLVDLILELRQALREAQRWDMADRARDVLVGLGYVIADSPSGATWSRAEPGPA